MIGLSIIAFVKKMEQISKDVKHKVGFVQEEEAKSLNGKDYSSYLDDKEKKELYTKKDSKKGKT